jgi:hypothetical protein
VGAEAAGLRARSDLRKFDRRCDARLFAGFLRLSRTGIADEMREAHARRC